MRTINYESDFKLVEGFKDGSSIYEAPFRFTYYTKLTRGSYVAEYDGVNFTNCRPSDDGRVIVPFDSPKLGMGVLMVKREFFLNDSDFNDGICNLVSVESTGITLDKGATDDLGEIEVLVEPYYHVVGSGGDIPNGSITTAKIKDGAVTEAKIADKAVTEDKLSDEVKEKLNQAGSSFNGSASDVTFDGDSVGLISKDVQSAIEEVNAKIDMYKEATIDFGTGEDTVTMAIMNSGTTITKVKTKNVKTLYLSYGNVTKAEYAGGEVSLGNADFLVMTIIRTASDVDAVVGLTLR